MIYKLFLFASLHLCTNFAECVEVLRPRGVSLSNKIFYDPRKDFTCIDGSGTFPFKFVNDDYCDCEDGTDEPGTSACSNGVFTCPNAGYYEKSIPSSRANDGICDCCDGSDEFNSTKSCENNCLALGAKQREEQARLKEILQQGQNIRSQYIREAQKKRDENRIKLEALKKEVAEAEAIKNEKDAIKKEAEEKEKIALDKIKEIQDVRKKEREEAEMHLAQEQDRQQAEIAFKELDINGDQLLTFNELQQFSQFDQNSDGVVTEEEAKFFLHMKSEMDLDEFKETGWVIAKPYFLKDKAPETDALPEDVHEPQLETGHEHEPTHETEEDLGHEDLSEPVEPITSDDLPEEEEDEEDEGKPFFPREQEDSSPPEPTVEEEYDQETKSLVEAAKAAKAQYSEVEGRYFDLTNKIREIEVNLETDYGPDDAFMPLYNQCFEMSDREYTYKLCLFDRAVQKSKDGGAEVNLGRWGKWSGSSDFKYEKMKYDGGATCWNGPARSVEVSLRCGLENKLISATEPNRCEYAYEFETPALCVLRSFGEQTDGHDEL